VRRARVVIATVGLALSILWFTPPLVFNLGVVVVIVLATRELFLLHSTGNPNAIYRRVGLIAAGLLPFQMLAVPQVPIGVSIPLLLAVLLSATVVTTKGPSAEEFHDLLFVMFGVVYMGGMLGQLIPIRNARLGRELTAILIVTILAREAGATLGGLLFPSGKLLNGNINPKKSYVGALVGMGAAVGVASILSQYVAGGLTLPRAVLFGCSLGVACQLGDLSESYVKRVARRRHSGNLLGPEGGLLDFLDAAAFAMPVARLMLVRWGN